MAKKPGKAPEVTAVFGELQGSPVVRFDVKTRGDSVTLIVGLDKRSVQAYFGKPGLIAAGTGVAAPKGPRGTKVTVFAAAASSTAAKKPTPRKPAKPKPVPLGDDPPPPIKPPN